MLRKGQDSGALLEVIKEIVREVRGLPHESTRWHTARKIATQRTSSEGQEGLKAFLEKREPAWRDEGGLKD